MAYNGNGQNRASNFKINWDFQTKYLKQVEGIVYKHITTLASVRLGTDDEDMKQATDMVLEIHGGTIAVRVRDARYKYRDLTIRSSVPTGNQTEIDKIRAGFADWYIYGWADQQQISEYILVNLAQVRYAKLLETPRRQIRNRDGTTFIAITINELNECGALVAHKTTKPSS